MAKSILIRFYNIVYATTTLGSFNKLIKSKGLHRKTFELIRDCIQVEILFLKYYYTDSFLTRLSV